LLKNKIWSCKYLTGISIISGLLGTLLLIIWLLMFYADVYSENSFMFLGYIMVLCVVVALIFGVIVLIQNCLTLFVNLDNLCCLASLIFSAMLMMAIYSMIFQNAKNKRGEILEGSYQLNRLAKEIFAYADDNNGFLPCSDQWCDLLIKHNGKFPRKYFQLPKWYVAECNFAFNENISGLPLSKINPETVLLFKAMGNWNLSGHKELSESYLKNNMDTVVILKSGKVEYLSSDDELKNLRWQP
jgi:hypothetical protein